MDDLKGQVEALFVGQLNDWQLFADRYAALMSRNERVLNLNIAGDTVPLLVCDNPARLLSTTARVNMERAREDTSATHCMLCHHNRPAGQRALPWHGRRDMEVLVNPYPIVDRHFTVATVEHCPQCLDRDTLSDMLSLTGLLPDYAVSYNGPRCGASIPWHLHLQAFPVKHTLLGTIATEASPLTRVVGKLPVTAYIVAGVDDVMMIDEVLTFIGQLRGDSTLEPMLNAVAWKSRDITCLAVMPRAHHRPANFGVGQGQLLWSPGILDLLGVVTLPRREDYDNLTVASALDVYNYIAYSLP